MELAKIDVDKTYRSVDQRQLLLFGQFERDELSEIDYREEWSSEERRARQQIVGQGMFSLVAGRLFDKLRQADYMQIIDEVTRDPNYTVEQRLDIIHELRPNVEKTVPLEVYDPDTKKFIEVDRITLGR